MRYARRFGILAAALAIPAITLIAADHKEAPLIAEDPSADLADFYCFLKPGDPSRIIMMATVNPFMTEGGGGFNFSPNVRYAFRFETDNNGKPDTNVFVNFAGSSSNPTFRVQVPSKGVDFTAPVTRTTAAVNPNPAIITTDPSSGITAFAGPRDDPFFFDAAGFNRFLAGTGGFGGNDFFGGYNVSAIVLEVPTSLVAGSSTQLQGWATTERRRVTLRRADSGQLEVSTGPWEQVDRVGNPAVSTALIPSGLKDLFNIGTPNNDAQDFAPAIVASLQAFGTSQANINILASVALPDTLKLDLAAPSAYPNGRAPADDVIDTLLGLILNAPTADGVDMNDKPFPAVFPYLADPFQPPA